MFLLDFPSCNQRVRNSFVIASVNTCSRVLLTDIVLDCQEGQEKIWAGSLVTVELKHQRHSFHSFGWERCGSQSEQPATRFRFSWTARLISHGNRSVYVCVHVPFLETIDSSCVWGSGRRLRRVVFDWNLLSQKLHGTTRAQGFHKLCGSIFFAQASASSKP